MGALNPVAYPSNEWQNPALPVDEQREDLSVSSTSLLPNSNPLESNSHTQGYLNPQMPPNGMAVNAAPPLPTSLPQNELTIGLGMTPTLSVSPGGNTPSVMKSPDPSAPHFPAVDIHQNAQMSLTQSDPLASVTTVDAVSFQNTLGGSVLTDPSKALPEIGSIVDEMASVAADARVHFHGGQFDKSSEKVESLKKMVKRIGDIGAMSMNIATENQHPPGSSTGGTVPPQSISQESEKQLYSAALFSSAADNFEPRKRRVIGNQVSEMPMKAPRSQSISTRARSRSDLSDIALHLSHMENKWGASSMVSPTFQSSQFDFHLGSAPCQGQNQPTQSSAFSFSDAAKGPPMLSSTQPDHVMPVVPEQPHVVTQAVSLPATPPTGVPPAKPMGTLGQIPENQPKATMLPSSSMALNLALEQPSSDSWQGDKNGQVMTPNPLNNNDPLDNSNSNLLDSTDDGWESFTMMDRAAATTELSPELRVIYDKVFLEYLNSLCSNLEARDERGELIHQTLMPKKMARLDESPDFRPFKFRIQAFTNAFQTELQRNGLSEEDSSLRKIKPYLWTHPYISRFNEDGKKAKSKGNHIWNVEARRLPGGGWEFFTFTPKITAATSKVAYVGEQWSWTLRIWDPQASSNNIKVVYTANTMPKWLHWEEDEKVVTGIPSNPSESGEVSVTALYVQYGQLHRLEHSFFLQVLPPKLESHSVGEMPSTLPEVPPTQQSMEMYASQPTPAPVLAMRMSGTQPELQKHEVVEPSHAPDVLSSIPFPFTPPVYMDKVHRPFHFDPSLLHGQPTNPTTPGSAFTGSTGPQTAVFVNNTASHGVAPSMPNTAGVHTSPTAPLTVPVSNEPGVPAAPPVIQEHEPSAMLQMWNAIERRQQEQTSSLMLLMPQRPQAFSLNEHPGQGTPMSNMPNDISASLPPLNPNPPP